MTELRKNEHCEIGFERAINAILNYARIHQIVVANRMETAVELFCSKDNKSVAAVSVV